MITATALLLFTLLCLFIGMDRAWSNVTLPERNELVFAERHRGYGAYRLRREYDHRLIIAFIGAVGLLGLVGAIPKLIARLDPPVIVEHLPPTVIVVDTYFPPPTVPDVPRARETRTMIPPAAHPEENHFVQPADSLVPPTPPIDTNSVATVIPPIDGIGDGPIATGRVPDGRPVDGLDPGPVTLPPNAVDELPEFPGGQPGLALWVRENLILPDGVSGKDKVYVQFTVGTDGMVTDAQALTGRQSLCKEAAEHTVARMPRWKPARMNGHDVRCRLTLPIRFEVR